MDFINSSIDVKNLPAIEKASLHAVHSSYKKILQVEWLIATIVLSLIAAAVILINPSFRHSYGWLIILSLLVLVCSSYYFAIQKSFPFLAYAVRERDVVHQKGWLVRRVKTCPFNRIQNCSVQSGPLERRYGLASLIVYTAGTNGADMRISGLVQEEADRLRYFILSSIHNEPNEAV